MSNPLPYENSATFPDEDDEVYCDDDDDFDCHLGPDGQCGKAGSEECDWECPLRNSQFFAGNPGFKPRGAKREAAPEPVQSLAGMFYWPSAEYSVPADNLCWHIPPSPYADHRCIRERGHPGKHSFECCPKTTDFPHKKRSTETP